MIEDHRTILRSDIRSLSIQGRGIVVRPKNIEQLIVADLRRIELNLHDFRVTGLVAANILVARIFLVATGIPDRSRSHAFEFSKSLFHTPKTARAKCRFLRCHSKQSNVAGGDASRTSWHLKSRRRATTMLMSCVTPSPSNRLAPRLRSGCSTNAAPRSKN